MSKTITIGTHKIGDGYPCFIIAEIGINHNGSIDLAKKMIDIAVTTGCDAVKFQKRTIDIVYTKEELAKERKSIFGNTNGDLKRGWNSEQKNTKKLINTVKRKVFFGLPPAGMNRLLILLKNLILLATKLHLLRLLMTTY